MGKKRTSQRFRRGLRQGLAAFVAVTALWLVWLTADPSALTDRIRDWMQDSDLSIKLLQAELGEADSTGLSLLDQLVLSQSSLLSGTILPEVLDAPPIQTQEEPLDDEEPEESSAPSAGPSDTPDVIGKTMVAGTSSKYVTSNNVSIYNHTDYTLDIDALLAAAPSFTISGSQPQVLILHSHATEAYTMSGSDVYEASSYYRTLDTGQNVVRIGTEIAAILESAGIGVIHDTTLFDYPSYNEAYTRSVAAVADWLEQYPSIQIIIDVHRDALEASDGTLYKTVAGTVNNCAQVMMVMGTDASGQTHPNWRVNLALAVSLQQAMADKWATLARPIVLRTTRFNQHLSTGSILLEVGTHGNTLQEAITAARLFARTLADQLTK